MSGKLGSRLAQLANAKKQADDVVLIPKEDLDKIEAERAASNVTAIQLVLLPHVDEFNSVAEASLHIALETAVARIVIKQRRASMLTLEISSTGAVIKRKSGEYSSDDYFTIGKVSDGSMTFSNYSAEVARPLNANQFAELVLMEALGLS